MTILKSKHKKTVSIDQMSRQDKKNVHIKNGELRIKNSNHKVKASPPKRKPEAPQIPVFNRQFVIIDSKKFSFWQEEKNKGRTGLKLSSSVKGEIIRPKSAKRLDDHSLTKLNKRTFNLPNA